MARIISTKSNAILHCNIITVMQNGTEVVKEIKTGDIIEGLRYVENEQIKTVSGRVKGFNYTNSRSSNGTYNSISYTDDISIASIVLDASAQYESKIVTVPLMEIIEDEGVTAVDRMRNTPVVELKLEFHYSDRSTKNESLVIGDVIENSKFMGANPGDADITGKFTVVGFWYDLVSSVLKISGIVLKPENGDNIVVMLDHIITFDETTVTTVSTPAVLASAIENTSTPKAILTVDASISLEDMITVPAGRSITLELGDNSIITDPTILDDDGKIPYAFENNGELIINGGIIDSRGIINNGTLILNGTKVITEDFVGGAAVVNTGDLTINEGTILKTTYVGSVSEAKGVACVRNNGDNAHLVVNGGTFESVNNRGYCIISSGDVQINSENVVVAGAHGGLAVDGGTAYIKGGTFSSQNFYGLYVSNDDLKADVVVENGEFTGKRYSVWCGSDDNESVDSIVIIKGGTFNNPVKDQSNVAEGAGISISGGKFKEEVVPAAYLADGYECASTADADGYYVVSAVAE